MMFEVGVLKGLRRNDLTALKGGDCPNWGEEVQQIFCTNTNLYKILWF